MDLEAERESVVEAGRRLARAGLVHGTSGNLSVRADDRVVVSPSGLPLDALEPEDLTVIDLTGVTLDGPYGPTSETPLHLAIYAATDASAVAHVHAATSAAVACTCTELPPAHYNCLVLGGPVRVAPYATYGTPELAANVVAALEDRNAALMANHGSIAHGATLDQACERVELLEWLCEHWARAVALGPPRVLSEGELAEAAASIGAYGVTARPGPDDRGRVPHS